MNWHYLNSFEGKEKESKTKKGKDLVDKVSCS